MKLYSTNTTARKMQLKQELHNVQRNKLSINKSMKVKGLADSLGSIGVLVDDEDLSVCDPKWSWERTCTISDIHWSP